MRKKVRVGMVVIFVVLVISCFGFLQKDKENGNLANQGLACEAKGTVYYNKYEKGIFAVKNGKEKQLTDETAYGLNIVGNKLYYLTIADFNSIVIKSVDFKRRKLAKFSHNLYFLEQNLCELQRDLLYHQ